jgi:mono/diheme cytochrome c family protein
MIVAAASLVLILTGSALAADSVEGARIYRQWCSTCHGDRGQGLTEEWRATWPKTHQNCWQAKCHAASHPPDGFSFPKEVPAVIGSDALKRFDNAQALYDYVRTAMPYWSPRLLEDDQYRAITVFLVEANYSVKGLTPPASLDEDLASVPLHPAPRLAASGLFFPSWALLLFLPILIGLGLGIWIWRRSTSK